MRPASREGVGSAVGLVQARGGWEDGLAALQHLAVRGRAHNLPFRGIRRSRLDVGVGLCRFRRRVGRAEPGRAERCH